LDLTTVRPSRPRLEVEYAGGLDGLDFESNNRRKVAER